MLKFSSVGAVLAETLVALTGWAACSGNVAIAAADVQGRISDARGAPIAGATVVIWTAAVKTGYSTFCPSCYADCGKRAITDEQGEFAFDGLDRNLRFRLLVACDGFAPTFVDGVDPLHGLVAATLPRRETPQDTSRLVRGRVVGPRGEPVRHAVVEPEFVRFRDENGRIAGMGGAPEGLDPLAVTNDAGEFEIAYRRPALEMTVMVKARGMAPKRFAKLTTGEERHVLAVSGGATVRGRLTHEGRAVADAEMGLMSKSRAIFEYFPEERIGTQQDGTFVFPSVPVPGEWYVYAKMDSIVRWGATAAIACATSREDEDVDLGDVEVKPGHRLRGQVILTDGQPIADGMRIFVTCDRAWDTQTVALPADGRFEFANLPSDDYSIHVGVKGYRLSPQNPNLGSSIEGLIDRDVDDFVILLDRGGDDFLRPLDDTFKGKPLRSAPRP